MGSAFFPFYSGASIVQKAQSFLSNHSAALLSNYHVTADPLRFGPVPAIANHHIFLATRNSNLVVLALTLRTATMMNLRSISTFASRAVSRRLPATAVAAGRAFSAAASGDDELNYPIIPESDHGAFREYSVIHTDRSLNLMSAPFGQVMRDLNVLLKHTYNADKVAIIPG